MKCFIHRKKDAIGICSVCFKGVCEKCIAQTEPIICKSCAEKIKKGEIEYPVKPSYQYDRYEKEPIEMKVGVSAKPRTKASKIGRVKNIWDKMHAHQPLHIDNRISFDIVTPVALFGMITGILMGIPLLSILFFIFIPIAVLLSIIYIRMENDYKEWVGEKKGMVTGLLVGIVTALVSLVIFIAMASYIGPMLAPFFQSISDGSLVGQMIITLASSNAVVTFGIIKLRFILTFTLYPIFGILSGYYFARKLR